MTEATAIKNESSEAEPKPRIFASVSAKTLAALTPMIRETQDFAHSEYAFMSQMPTRLFGTYLLPLEKGVLLVVVGHCRVLAVFDAEGRASAALKIYFPDGLLDTVQTKTVSLVNENGISFEVEVEPKPSLVHCSDGFAIVFADHQEKWQQERFDGCFGTWFNGDHGNVIDSGSYRAELANLSRIKTVIEASLDDAPESLEAIDINSGFLTAISHAANALGTTLSFRFYGRTRPIKFFSTTNENLFGFLMPAHEQTLDAEKHFVRTALASALKTQDGAPAKGGAASADAVASSVPA
jgi:hypothetical protein